MLPGCIARAGREDSTLARWQQSMHNLQCAARVHPSLGLLPISNEFRYLGLGGDTQLTIFKHNPPPHPSIYIYVSVHIYLINSIFFRNSYSKKKMVSKSHCARNHIRHFRASAAKHMPNEAANWDIQFGRTLFPYLKWISTASKTDRRDLVGSSKSSPPYQRHQEKAPQEQLLAGSIIINGFFINRATSFPFCLSHGGQKFSSFKRNLSKSCGDFAICGLGKWRWKTSKTFNLGLFSALGSWWHYSPHVSSSSPRRPSWGDPVGYRNHFLF